MATVVSGATPAYFSNGVGLMADGSVALQNVVPPKPADGSMVVLRRNAASAMSLDVFGSPRLASALEHARKHFDVIVVEGPPIMLVADALAG